MEDKYYQQEEFTETITTIDIRDVKPWVANERWKVLGAEYLGNYQIQVRLGRRERVYYERTGETFKSGGRVYERSKVVRREVIED